MAVNNTTQQHPHKEKGYFLPLLIAVIVLITLGTGGYLLYQKQSKSFQNLIPLAQSPSSTTASLLNRVSTPKSPSTPITSCIEIKSGGDYLLTQDVQTTSNRCLNIHDANNITIDCQNHSITAGQAENIWVAKVQNFSVRNCNLVINLSKSNSEGGDGIVIDDSNSGIIEKNIISEGGIRIRKSNHVQILNNTVKGHSPFGQSDSAFNQIRGNKFTANADVAGPQISNPGGGFIGSGGADGVVVSQNGSDNTIENNIIDGSSDGISHSSGNIGADDGILLAGGEKNGNITGNTIKNIWDCGIENIGPIQDIQITKNRISNSGVCGIGGWYWNSWLRNKVDTNVIDGTPIMFYFYRVNSLLNEKGGLHEQNVFFQDNTFSNNTFSNPKVIAGKKAISASIDFENIPSEISASVVKLGNNIFKNNNFGQEAESPFITPSNMVVDQKGNKCLFANDNSHPLQCN